jgi:hypothetical protein
MDKDMKVSLYMEKNKVEENIFIQTDIVIKVNFKMMKNVIIIV